LRLVNNGGVQTPKERAEETGVGGKDTEP